MALTYLPAYKHTYLSEVNLTKLPGSTMAVRKTARASSASKSR